MQLGGCADFYILSFGVVYLACCDFVMDSTKEQQQILFKSRKKLMETLAMITQAFKEEAEPYTESQNSRKSKT
jgi:hypothetical protein